ncbi:MAG: phosphoribosylformylglycinamidine synthase subunit PurQ [Bacteroidota bacterium]
MKFGVIVFPGSNCDHDAYNVVKNVIGQEAELIWHKENSVGDVDAIILPGGFSYGDYLRCGAIARFSPIMKDVIRFANNGGIVIGICNGFQVLVEAGLLPGALLQNNSLKFICDFVNLKVLNNNSIFTSECKVGEVLNIPIAHGEGNYFADNDTLKKLQDNNQIVLQYCDKFGNVNDESNPNGAKLNIAGIINEKGNILGMMPHPERAAEKILGSNDGLKIFQSIINQFVNA